MQTSFAINHVCWIVKSFNIFFFWYLGGLDSSLITALVVECAKEMELSYPIQTYSVGMEGSPDLKAARVVIISIKTLKY